MDTEDIIGAMERVADTIASLEGGLDALLSGLLTLMVLDVLTGAIVALWLKKSKKTESGGFSATVFRKGVFQKVLILAVIAVSVIIDHVMTTDLMRDIVVMFYIAEEAMSVIENANSLGVPVPKRLMQVLDVIENEIESDETVEKD